MTTAIFRLSLPGGVRWALGTLTEGPERLLAQQTSLAEALAEPKKFDSWFSEITEESIPSEASVLAPVDRQEVWAAGVTFKRSRTARRAESSQPDHYDLVYDADRPELFFKATPERVRAPGEALNIRRDSAWNVPEPEVGLVASARGRIVGYTLGNDMSSRSIEGDNPLYLPQAKVYDGSCSVGPCIVPADEFDLMQLLLSMRIERDGRSIFDDAIQMSEMRRTPQELVDWLFRALTFPAGVVVLTGTGLVPPNEFTLKVGDRVSIGLGDHFRLTNPVAATGTASVGESDY